MKAIPLSLKNGSKEPMLAPKISKKERRCIQLTLPYLDFMLKEPHGKEGSRNDPAFICCKVLIFWGRGVPPQKPAHQAQFLRIPLSLSAAGGEGENKPSPRATHSPERARIADGYEVYCTRTPASRFDLAKKQQPQLPSTPCQNQAPILSRREKLTDRG